MADLESKILPLCFQLNPLNTTLQANLGYSCIFLKIALHLSLVFFLKESELDF